MLRAEDFFIDPKIREALTLPREAYIRAEFQELEIETIFRRMWLMVPEWTAADLRKHGQSLDEFLKRSGRFYPFDMLGNSLLLQRDTEDQTLSCVSNVCTHAWHTLEDGPGVLTKRHKLHICPQHGRQFDSKGKCISQPEFTGKMENFPCKDDNLPVLPLSRWEQFLFMSLGEPIVRLDEVFAPINESLGTLKVRDFKRHLRDDEEAIKKGNWKFHLDNYMDFLHVSELHGMPGGLADELDMKSYKFEFHPFCSLQWAYAKNPEDGFEPGVLHERFTDPKHPDKRVYALWWQVLPNTDLNFYKWGMSINTYSPVLGDPEKTLWRGYHYIRDEKEYDRLGADSLKDRVHYEDIDAVARSSQGARSRFAMRKKFGPEKKEEGRYFFQRFVYSMMFER